MKRARHGTGSLKLKRLPPIIHSGLLMSWLPAAFALLAAALMLLYPLTTEMTEKITEDLAIRRASL